jgi:hypothetical protein
MSLPSHAAPAELPLLWRMDSATETGTRWHEVHRQEEKDREEIRDALPKSDLLFLSSACEA